MYERIVVDPKVCHGKPVVRGTRTPVTVILDALAAGDNFEMIQSDYDITSEDIRACIALSQNPPNSHDRQQTQRPADHPDGKAESLGHAGRQGLARRGWRRRGHRCRILRLGNRAIRTNAQGRTVDVCKVSVIHDDRQ